MAEPDDRPGGEEDEWRLSSEIEVSSMLAGEAEEERVW